jgi:hypothetical protein
MNGSAVVELEWSGDFGRGRGEAVRVRAGALNASSVEWGNAGRRCATTTGGGKGASGGRGWP